MTGITTGNRIRQSLRLQTAWSGFTAIDRLIYVSIAMGSSCAILMGRYLTPSASGVGTHQQLGLPACPTLHLTGYPCPSCGLTTSFALAAQLEFIEAFQVQPFGLVAFFLASACIPISAILISRRISVNDLIFARGSNRIMYFLLALYIGSWVYKIMIMAS